MEIDLTGISKAKVLAALYNRAGALGMGYLHFDPKDMTEQEAEEFLQEQQRFDYLKGRVMKIDLAGDTLDPRLYDRDNGGEGAAYSALIATGIIEWQPE